MRCLVSIALVALVVGCSSEEAPLPEDSPTLFSPDPAAEGPRLWLEIDGALTASLWAAELGPVFGWSVHLSHEESVTVAGASLDPVLGTEALTVAAARRGDVALAATLPAPDRGEVAIEAPTRLGEMTLEASGAPSRLALGRLVVRRASGEYVAAAALGGLLDPSARSQP